MKNNNEFILNINNDEYIVSENSLILLKNILNKTQMIIRSNEYLRLSDEVKNKFILENIGN